jgi:putative transposase
MLTGRRYLLDFTDDQANYAETVGGICRAVWNNALEQRREYRRRGAFISYVEQARQMAEAKKDPYCGWMSDAPAHTLQQTLRDLERACKANGPFKVRWRSKARSAPSFRFPDPSHITIRRLSRRWGEARLPKFGPVRFRWTRPLGGSIRNATVARDGGRWYISFCVEDDVTPASPNCKPPVGVDRGVAVAVATSDGDLHDRQLITPGEAKRLKRMQQRLSRSLRVHGRNRRSKRRDRVCAGIGRLNTRIRNRRADFAAQTAIRLVRHHGMVVAEKLSIKNMAASARGTVESPGRNVRQKAGLNRAILAKGWGGLLLAIEQAGRYHGATVVKVNPAYTSQTCHACKHIAQDNRESQAVFRCVACGHEDHADVNAARNILAAGLAVTGRGDLAAGRSVKRQPSKRLAA